MNRIELSALHGEALVRGDLELGAGVHTVVAFTPHGADELVRMAAGTLRPVAGAVRIDGMDPYSSPEARRRVGSLFASEVPPEDRTVEAAVARALSVARSSTTAASVLGAAGLPSLLRRRPSSLSPCEARGVALALALSKTEAGVLLLFEPLATPAGRARVVEAIAQAAARGASVLCVTASTRDAADLGGRSFPLRFGRIGGETPVLPVPASDAATLEIVVRTDDPRMLASALSLDPVFSDLRCDLELKPGEVVVSGADSERVALGVLRGARDSGAKILALWQRKRSELTIFGSGVRP